MYKKKLHIPKIFSNLECSIFKLYNLVMCNLYTKFVKFLEICKEFSEDLVTEAGNVRRPGPVPRFSDLEVIALSMAAEAEEIDSENWLFEAKLKECRSSIPNLISRRQFNDRRKVVSGLCEQIRSRIANHIDGGEDYFCIDSKPIEVCRVSRIIHSYDLSKASVHDINYLNDIKPLYHDCSIFGDKGYIGAEIQLDLFETVNIRLECPYRLNQKNWKPTFIPFAKARKRVETLFSQLTDQFLVIRNYAKETCGLFARIVGKVSAMTALQYINYINNKPIGRIKYALI